MNVRFLDNPTQRDASGKTLPTRQLEAVIRYGATPDVMKVVKKVMENAFTLAISKATHHIVCTVISRCNDIVRCELLFSIRTRLMDMARSGPGREVLQTLVSCVPSVQKREIAEHLKPELLELCKHGVANHAIQAVLGFQESREELLDTLREHCVELATSRNGQYVINRLLEVADAEEFAPFAESLVEGAETILSSRDLNDVPLFATLLRSKHLGSSQRHALVSKIIPNLPKWLEEEKFAFLISNTVEHVNDAAQAKELAIALKPHFQKMLQSTSQVRILATITSHGTAIQRRNVSNMVLEDVTAAAQDQCLSVVLREVLEHQFPTIDPKVVEKLVVSSHTLAFHRTGSPVLQALVKGGKGNAELLQRIVAASQVDKETLKFAQDVSASHFVQTLIREGSEEIRRTLWSGCSSHVPTLAKDRSGAYVIQCLVAHGDTSLVQKAAESLKTQVAALSLDPTGCFTVRSILLKCSELNLASSRKEIVDELKPCVYTLALSPGVGSLVLDAMIQVASDQLSDAVKKVVFLKSEQWLSELHSSEAVPRQQKKEKKPRASEEHTEAPKIDAPGNEDGEPKKRRKLEKSRVQSKSRVVENK